MNRKERRKYGFTESRFRKMDSDEFIEKGFNPRMVNPFYSYSRNSGYDILFDSTRQRTNRLDGEPRRWQVERERRRNKL